MHLEGSTQISAPIERVWQVLTDPHEIARCLPGAPAVEVQDDRHLKVSATVGNFPLRTTVVVDVEITELEPTSKAGARASGAVMGSPIEGVASLRMEAAGPAATNVAWEAEIALGGGLAGFASMAEAPARDGVDRTLGCLKARLEAPSAV